MNKTNLLATFAVALLAYAANATAQTFPVLRSGTISAASASCLSTNCVASGARYVPSFGIEVTGSGTWTLVVEGSRDGGTTYRTIIIKSDADGSTATSITAAGSFAFSNDGYSDVRVRASTYSSGTPAVSLTRGEVAAAGAGGGGGGGGDFSITAYNASFGVAGTPDSQVMSVQGISGGTAIPVTGTFNVDGSTVTANLGATDNAVLDAIAASVAGTLTVGSHAVTNAGTFATQAAQSGTWNVTNVSGTVSLPTGASTAANQSTAITALQLIDNPIGSSTGGTAGTSSSLAGGIYNSSAPTLTNGQQASLQLDSSGRVVIACGSGCSGSTTTDTDDGSIAGSQSAALSISLLHGWNGSGWVRATTPTDATADAAALTTGPQLMGYGSSSTPTAMSANGDATPIWTSLNGSVNTILRGTDGTSAFGTAGSSATPVLSMQGIAGGTALGVSDNAGSLTVDAPVTTPVFVRLSDGSSAIATLPVSLASVPSHAVTNAGTFAVQPAGSVEHDAAATSVNPVLVGGYASTTVPTAVSTATDSVRQWMTLNGAQVVVNSDPCGGRGTKVFVPISQATSTQLFTGTASNRTFVCSVSIMQRGSSTQTWSLVSGTGTVCATGTGALIGATTAANGTDLSMTQGSGTGTILKTATDADNVCLLQSGTDRLNGYITYVVSPNQ